MAFPSREDTQDKTQAVRLLAQITVTLAQIGQISDPDPELDAQASDLRALEAELQDMLQGRYASRGSAIDLIQRASQITHTAVATLASHLADGASGSGTRAQAMIAQIQDRERTSRASYDSFLRSRSTPTDPEIEAELKKAQAAYNQALRSGDALAVSNAGLDLLGARTRDTAYAFGRGDPAARKAHQAQVQDFNAGLRDHARVLEAEGAEPKAVEDQISERKEQFEQQNREAAEKGARDAGRSLNAANLDVLGKIQKAEPPSQFAALERNIEEAKPDTPVTHSEETQTGKLPPTSFQKKDLPPRGK